MHEHDEHDEHNEHHDQPSYAQLQQQRLSSGGSSPSLRASFSGSPGLRSSFSGGNLSSGGSSPSLRASFSGGSSPVLHPPVPISGEKVEARARARASFIADPGPWEFSEVHFRSSPTTTFRVSVSCGGGITTLWVENRRTREQWQLEVESMSHHGPALAPDEEIVRMLTTALRSRDGDPKEAGLKDPEVNAVLDPHDLLQLALTVYVTDTYSPQLVFTMHKLVIDPVTKLGSRVIDLEEDVHRLKLSDAQSDRVRRDVLAHSEQLKSEVQAQSEQLRGEVQAQNAQVLLDAQAQSEQLRQVVESQSARLLEATDLLQQLQDEVRLLRQAGSRRVFLSLSTDKPTAAGRVLAWLGLGSGVGAAQSADLVSECSQGEADFSLDEAKSTVAVREAGVYQVSAHVGIAHNPINAPSIKLLKNGAEVRSAFLGTNTNWQQTAQVQALLELRAGDTVQVQNLTSSSSVGISSLQIVRVADGQQGGAGRWRVLL